MQTGLSPAAADAITTAKRESNKRGPGPTITDIKFMSLSFDADPVSAFILESPEEVGRSRIPEFYESGVYHQLTFDMAFDFFKPHSAKGWPAVDGPATLFWYLRAVDAAGLDVVLAVPPPATGLGLAVLDRLRRASAPRP